jgi:hypothetical protein
LRRYREEIVERQLDQERLAWAAIELYGVACVLSRRDAEPTSGKPLDPHGARVAGSAAADLYLRMAMRRIRLCLDRLNDNDDAQVWAAAAEAGK